MGEFKVGDRVQMVTGGGALTVAEVSGGRADCGSGGSYEPRELQRYDPQHDPLYAPLFPARPRFKPGDRVRRDGDGREMVVHDVSRGGVTCARRDTSGVDTFGTYHPADLEFYDTRVDPAPSAAPAFGLGDVVRLKGGGLRMTVTARAVFTAQCAWHLPSGELAGSWISTACLEPAAPDPR